MPAPIRPETKAKFDRLLANGHTARSAAKECGVSEAWAYDRSKGRRKKNQAKYYSNLDEDKTPGPKARDELDDEALAALEDFAYFRLRYCGRKSSPWEVDAAQKMLALIASDAKEYVVINAPPGGGKTTLFTHDIPLWLICRDRSIRILIGGAVQSKATVNANRLRKTLQVVRPYQATDDDLLKGMVDAQACVAVDYGRFKPDNENPDLWTASSFSVMQVGHAATADKEPTVQAYGRQGGVLGSRVNLAVWDDLVTLETMQTVEAREGMKRWWKEIAETRIDPRGVMALQGQRLDSDDLYRYALDMKGVLLDDDGEEVLEEEPPAKYQHIVYKAHYEDLCTGKHPRGLEPWPASCLLDPYKLPWRDLLTAERDDLQSYSAVYQQEDVEGTSKLARKLWIKGGQDPQTHEVYPGCWDGDRSVWQLPRGLDGEVHIYATADPSPSKFWAIETWAYHPKSEQLFLLALERCKMGANDFLDRDPHSGAFTGVMNEWQEHSEKVGLPIRTWIIENNAAQRFLFQFNHFRAWQSSHMNVAVIAHATTQNKSDATYGIRSMSPLFKSGRVRLPGNQDDGSRLASLKLVDEATRWPNGATDDTVLAMWFGWWNLESISSPWGRAIQTRPSWTGAPRLVA